MNLRTILDATLDLIYPRIYCVRCGKLLQKNAVHGLCNICCDSMPFIHAPKCSTCGKPLDNAEILSCPDCIEYKHHFDQGLSVFELNTSVQELIYRYKYYKEFSLNRTFAHFMVELLYEANWHVDLIIPVPLHKNRLKSRGFNQSSLLGDYISQRYNIPCLDTILLRNVDTKTQTGFSRWERAKNLQNAFSVVQSEKIKDKNILLIDDIYTSGATADNSSSKLKESGANKVYILTVATGKNV